MVLAIQFKLFYFYLCTSMLNYNLKSLFFSQDSSFSNFSQILMQETPILVAHGFAEIISSSQSIKLRKVIQAFQKYIGSHMYSTNVTEVFKRFLELHFSRSYGPDKKPDLTKKYVCDAIKVNK